MAQILLRHEGIGAKKVMPHSKALKDILSLFRAKNKEPKAEFYVVPRNPTKQLSLENALLIHKTQKRYLLALWRLTRNEEDYVDYIEAIVSQC
jgi:hypothetical protein